jgi:hypothetical protein
VSARDHVSIFYDRCSKRRIARLDSFPGLFNRLLHEVFVGHSRTVDYRIAIPSQGLQIRVRSPNDIVPAQQAGGVH